MTKHKHAELIKQWADGAEIQLNTADGWKDINPSWVEKLEYRIKPEEKKPVVRWLWAKKNGAISQNLYTEKERISATFLIHYTIKLEWSRTEFPE